MLVTGAGPIGLLAALLGKQRGLEIHVLDRAESGPKPQLVRDLGATYHGGSVKDVGFEPDVIVECTGVGQVIAESIRTIGAGGIICLTGVGSGGIAGGGGRGRRGGRDGAAQQRDRRQRQRQQAALVQGQRKRWPARIDPGSRASLRGASGRRTSRSALERQPDDIKVVIQFAEA